MAKVMILGLYTIPFLYFNGVRDVCRIQDVRCHYFSADSIKADCQYFLSLDGNVQIENPELLRALIQYNRYEAIQ